MENRYRSGTIVHARGREWIVLPSREPEVLRLRPLTTARGEEVGLFLPLEGERVRPARFADPEAVSGGDATGIMTLFDAARLSLRSGAGPFRSLGNISVVPRPYQFVPLIMALRQSRVRLLIADDVGVGKTIEAAMIARELLDRGLARQLAVLGVIVKPRPRLLAERFARDSPLEEGGFELSVPPIGETPFIGRHRSCTRASPRRSIGARRWRSALKVAWCSPKASIPTPRGTNRD
jgi:hypothetical protein